MKGVANSQGGQRERSPHLWKQATIVSTFWPQQLTDLPQAKYTPPSSRNLIPLRHCLKIQNVVI